VAWLGWTWRHPTAFSEPGGFGHAADHYAVGEAFYADLITAPWGASGEVHIDSVEPHVVTNTADAEVDFYVCRLADAADGRLGNGGQDLADEFCGQLLPAEGGVGLQLDRDARQQLLVKVTLREPGTVRVAGADVTYSDGWQHGTQDTGGEVVVTTGQLDD